MPDGTQCTLATLAEPETCSIGLVGATVTLTPASGTSGSVKSKVACRDPLGPGGVSGCDKGTVTFDDLDLGTYDVAVSLNGWFWTDTDSVERFILSTIEPVVNRPLGKMMQYGRAQVTVRGAIDSNDSGVVLPSATVALRPVGGSANAASSTTGLNGVAFVEGTLPAGEYEVLVSATGYNSLTTAPRIVIVDALTTPRDDIVLIARAATLSGRVIDGGKTAPNNGLVGATISIDGFPVATAGTNGAYSITGLPPRLTP